MYKNVRVVLGISAPDGGLAVARDGDGVEPSGGGFAVSRDVVNEHRVVLGIPTPVGDVRRVVLGILALGDGLVDGWRGADVWWCCESNCR